MDIAFVRLVISLRMEAEVADPFALFAIKSDFEEAFLQAAPCRSRGEGSCRDAIGCPYHHAFAQELSHDPAALKRFQKPSVPFVFDFPILPSSPVRGKRVDIGLTLVGNATHFIPFYLAALRLLLRRGGIPAAIVGVDSLDYGGARYRIAEGEESVNPGRVVYLSFQGMTEAALLPPDELSLAIVTPLRILQEGRPLRDLSFSSFIRPIMRRVSSLAYYYGGVELPFDFKWLARKSESVAGDTDALQWVNWGRGRQGLAGLLGRVTFKGGVADFLPFLLTGEYLHVGKGASYGLGCYRVEKNS